MTIANHTPQFILTGEVQAGGKPGAAHERAWNALCTQFDTEDVRLITAAEGGVLRYIGCRTRDLGKLSDGTSFGTPLAAGLPGHYLYKGPGAYLTPAVGGEHVMLMTDGRSTHVHIGPEAGLLARALAGGHFVTQLGMESEMVEWESDKQLRMKFAMRHTRRAVVVGFGVLAVSSAIAMIAAAAETAAIAATRDTEAMTAKYATEIRKSLDSVRIQPLTTHLQALDRVQEVALHNDGLVKSYSLEGTGKATWTLSLPAYVSAHVYAPLGPATAIADEKGMILVTPDTRAQK